MQWMYVRVFRGVKDETNATASRRSNQHSLYTLAPIRTRRVVCVHRFKFVYRYIYINQDLFSVDGVRISKLTETPITPRLGIRHFIDQRPGTVTVVTFMVYLIVVAYIHNKLDGVANWWPEDRFCSDEDCPQVYDGEYPVTYLNSIWIHFVSASTIGYGEYLVSEEWSYVRTRVCTCVWFDVERFDASITCASHGGATSLHGALQVHTMFGRFLVCLSFIVGLLLSSFVVTVLFDALAISSNERQIIDQLRIKRMRKSLFETASVVIQRLCRSWLLKVEVRTCLCVTCAVRQLW